MANGKATQGRILWLDPNLANNVMVNPEDLSIKVEFNTFRKGRSIIYSGNQVISTAGGDATVGFINGSKVNNESTQPSLTTRYTDAIALEVMNTTAENADDFESLGIESIDIEFNTAYAPLIKIKFIDVRGNAILAQGNMSKYRMFFELPYPIFSLKVKGFYGGTVNYCLHMQRWNASFNSETGNFEIQADFIGYTYALLTDLLMGLIRAAVRTERGQKKLADKQAEYGDNSNLIISIDDMLLKFVELNNSFKKTSAEDSSVGELQDFNDNFTAIDNIRVEVDKLSAGIYDGNPPNTYFRSDNGDVVCIPYNADTEKKANDLITGFTKNIMPGLVTVANANLDNEDLKISEGMLKEIIVISQITKKELKVGNPNTTSSNVDVVAQKSGGKYDGKSDASKDSIKRLLDTIGDLSASSANDDSKINVYNFKKLYYELDNKKAKLEQRRKELETEVTNTLSDLTTETVGFDPTIRNVFRILCVNAEIFLEVLRDVSVEAQTDVSGKRATEFKKVSGNLNVRETDVNSSTIYPWPEYREEKDGKGYVETWLGATKNVIGANINEVVFVEEMLKQLLAVAKFDKDLQQKIDEAEASVDQPIEVKDPWFPLCAADTPVNDLLIENPYISITESGNVDEVKRGMLLRGFMLLGISSYFNKIPAEDGDNKPKLLEILGNLEAENIIAGARKHGKNGQDLITQLINNTLGDNSKELVNDLINNIGIKGSANITNPKGEVRPILRRMTRKYEPINRDKKSDGRDWNPANDGDILYYYTYITKTDMPFTTGYIPVNKSFDGVDFYSGGKLKSPSQLKELSESVLFVSNPVNLNPINISNTSYGDRREFYDNDDGSLLVKIIDYETYASKTMKPTFGSEVLEAYNAGTKEKEIYVDSSYDAIIKDDNLGQYQYTLKGLDPISGNYSALEISKLNYTYNDSNSYNYFMGEPKWDSALDSNPVASSLLAYYRQHNMNDLKTLVNRGGAYLSKVIDSKLKDNKILYENGDTIYYSVGLNTMATALYAIDINTAGDVAYVSSEDPIFNKAREIWASDGLYLRNKDVLNLKLNGTSDVYLPFIEWGTSVNYAQKEKFNLNLSTYNVSLFGSFFYYRQELDEAKALLFLHCIPWQGVVNPGDEYQEFMMLDKFVDWAVGAKETESNDFYTRVLSIRSMFQANSAFIHAPKAWVLFIGAMLWRRRYYANNGKDPIIYGDSNYEGRKRTLIPDSTLPDTDEFLYLSADEQAFRDNDAGVLYNPQGMFFGNAPSSSKTVFTDPGVGKKGIYVTIDKTLRFLPRQVRNEFITYFEDWVNDTNGFQFIKNELNLVKGTSKSDFDAWFNHCSKVKNENDFVSSSSKYKISRKKLEDIFGADVVNNYALISGLNNSKFTPTGNIVTVFKPGTNVMNYIVSLISEPVIIQNTNPNIWNTDNTVQDGRFDGKGREERRREVFGYENAKNSSSKYITMNGAQMVKYYDSLFKRLIKANKDFQEEKIVSEEDELEQEIFGTTDDNTIKLIIYRTLSSINDKWLNGSGTNSPFSQCGASTVNKMDLKHAKKYRGDSATNSTLIDTFRFVDRAFSDIGDDFYLNINSITDLIRSNYNQSFFDVVNKILSDNNFNFIPLPTFINFNDVNELSSIFTPYSYNNPITFEGTGPSFVCVFVGQTSVNLDLGVESVYPDDGFSIAFDSDGNLTLPKEASDFNITPEPDSLDNNVPVFSVNYGQQNQNYFKNIKLDQREFTETMESLQVIESISQTGDKSKPTYAGNNLFNVYQTRSYSAEIEMMGSAMIQPMMYFQLNNIPMFRGAYLIYKVTHSIKPHSMVTTFKGNRVKKSKTPLVDKATMFMNLVGISASGENISPGSDSGGSGGGRVASGSYRPIIKTIIDNGGTNGNVEAGKITLKPIPGDKLKAVGDPFGKLKNKDENKLISEAVEPLVQMLNDFTSWMEKENFKGVTSGGKKVYVYITSVFRDYNKQVQVKKDMGSAAATPGTSNHGWGIAVDIQFFDKNGNLIPNKKNIAKYFKFESNPAIKWLYDNSYKYGWVNPPQLRDGSGLEEHWHIEYHGTSSKKCNEELNTVYGYTLNTSEAVKSIVKNPKNPDGKEAVYTSCSYVKVKQGDGADNNATVGASREDMKVEKLKPGFDVKFKKIITNGNYAGINITNYQDDWIAVASNYIARNETFTCCPSNDEGTLRCGYGTDRILVNGSLKKVTKSTVFTEQVAKETLVYQTKNSFAKPLEKNLGTSNWNKLNKYQKAALLSLTYNTGPAIFGGSYGAQIKEGIASGDFNKAAQGILNGPITGAETGKVYPGLIRRRTEEARLFLLDKNSKVTYA